MAFEISPKEWPARIELQMLRPDATRAGIEAICERARALSCAGVCVNGSRVLETSALLEETAIQTICAIGYPLGAMDPDAKRYEIEAAIDNGAQQFEFVINIGWLKENRAQALLRELRDAVDAAEERPLSVMLESSLLTRDEKILACQIASEGGAQFVTASKGFTTGAASIEEIQLMRETLGQKFGLKAGGQIVDPQLATALLQAGADRIATSAGLELLTALEVE